MNTGRLLTLGALLAIVGTAAAPIDAHSLAATATATATAGETEDHAALAQMYRTQAADLRAQAERHRKQAQRHRGQGGKQMTAHQSMTKHCERIANNLDAAAKESEALAKLHESQVGQH